MRHTPSEAISTSRRKNFRLFRLQAIMIPICLLLCWSFSLPAFAQQAHQTTATQARQAAASCTPTQTRTFTVAVNGVTTFSDNPFLPGRGHNLTQQVVETVHLDSSGNICSFSLNSPVTLTDRSNTSANGNTAELDQANPSTVNPLGTTIPQPARSRSMVPWFSVICH